MNGENGLCIFFLKLVSCLLQVVAVKQLDRNGLQVNRETFLYVGGVSSCLFCYWGYMCEHLQIHLPIIRCQAFLSFLYF